VTTAVAQTVRLAPADKLVVLGDHAVDAIALELDAGGRLLDFRLELGRGYFIVWVLPIEPGGRMRRILVDCAVCDVDITLEQDPCELDLGPLEWSGELARVGPDGARILDHVRVELRGPWYACEARVRDRDGETAVMTVARAPASP
jgi:hypothetical protein